MCLFVQDLIELHPLVKEFVLQKQDSLWTLNGNEYPVGKAKDLLRELSHLTTDDFLDNPKDTLPPINTVIRFNDEEISFRMKKDSVNYIVKTSKSQQLFLIRKAKAEKLKHAGAEEARQYNELSRANRLLR